jgi:hypothetical protein
MCHARSAVVDGEAAPAVVRRVDGLDRGYAGPPLLEKRAAVERGRRDAGAEAASDRVSSA